MASYIFTSEDLLILVKKEGLLIWAWHCGRFHMPHCLPGIFALMKPCLAQCFFQSESGVRGDLIGTIPICSKERMLSGQFRVRVHTCLHRHCPLINPLRVRGHINLHLHK